MSAGIPDAIRAAGGALFAVTSEPQTLATEAVQTWGLDFEAVGDPHQEIADECRERGWLELYVQENLRMHERHVSWSRHPKGYFQPGVLALSREGHVLYRWRSRPTRKNIGGATLRVAPEHVWESVSKELARSSAGGDAPLDPTALEGRAPPWPLFVLLLLANGNFLRPRPFPLERGGLDRTERRSAFALAKLVLFLGGWAAALALLPTGWVLALLAVYAAAITPGIVEVHRTFQSVRD